MDFKDAVRQLSDKIEKLKGSLETEAATKNALIKPFINILGYDVFDPFEVMPEFTCDIGTKKGEKVDYAILKDGEAVMLIECKHWAQDLNLHDNQLLRYFHASKAKFGILTNGIIYRFYTDLEEKNKMDEKPFLEINLSDIRTNQIEELKKFHKTQFDVDSIFSSASELKYTRELKTIISEEFASPSPEFVKLFAKQVYGSIITPKVLEQFTALVRKSIGGLISDTITERLKSALKTEMPETKQAENTETKHAEVDEKDGKESEISVEKMECFYIIRAILRKNIESERVTCRNAQAYFSIFIDDNNRKPVCRLYLNSPTNKAIAFISDDKKEIKHKIESIDGIYDYSEQLTETVEKYK